MFAWFRFWSELFC